MHEGRRNHVQATCRADSRHPVVQARDFTMTTAVGRGRFPAGRGSYQQRIRAVMLELSTLTLRQLVRRSRSFHAMRVAIAMIESCGFTPRLVGRMLPSAT